MLLINLVSENGAEDCREVRRTWTRTTGPVLQFFALLTEGDGGSEFCPQKDGFVGTVYVMNGLGHTVARYKLEAMPRE